MSSSLGGVPNIKSSEMTLQVLRRRLSRNGSHPPTDDPSDWFRSTPSECTVPSLRVTRRRRGSHGTVYGVCRPVPPRPVRPCSVGVGVTGISDRGRGWGPPSTRRTDDVRRPEPTLYGGTYCDWTAIRGEVLGRRAGRPEEDHGGRLGPSDNYTRRRRDRP